MTSARGWGVARQCATIALLVTPIACAATRPSRPAPAPSRALASEPRVEAGELVATACGLPSGTVFFAPDSADLGFSGAELVDAIGACLTRGPLEGRAVVVVATADATGASWFDALLTRARGDSVANRLMHAGVDPVRMAKVSLPARAGRGPIEQAENRRAEIRLAR